MTDALTSKEPFQVHRVLEAFEPDLPEGFDRLDLDELLDVIGQLAQWLRVGSFDEADGERDVWERARRLLERYRSVE